MVSEEFIEINKAIYEELTKSSKWEAKWDDEWFITDLTKDGYEYTVMGVADIDKSLSPGMTLGYMCYDIQATEDILDRINIFNRDVDSVRASWYETENFQGVGFSVYFNQAFLSPEQYEGAMAWGINQIQTVLAMFVGDGKLFPQNK